MNSTPLNIEDKGDCTSLLDLEYLAEKKKQLPPSVAACLEMAGYKSVSSIIKIQIPILEDQMRTNAKYFQMQRPDLAKIAFVDQIQNDQFKFTPEQTSALQNFISGFSKTKSSWLDEVEVISPPKLPNEVASSELRTALWVLSCNETGATPCNVTINCDNGNVSRNIAKWCKKQTSPLLANLKEGKHYVVEMSSERQCVTCLLCGTITQIGVSKWSYFQTRRFYRHLKMCKALSDDKIVGEFIAD